MQIQALSASAPNFTAKHDIMPVPEGAVIRFDEGQPYLAFPLGSMERAPKEDTFARSSRSESEPKSISDAIAQRKPGYRPEDFLY